MADSDQGAGGSGNWAVTVILVVAIVGGALLWRDRESKPSTSPEEKPTQHLPRTRLLIQQKVASLRNFNQEMTMAQVLQGYSNMLKVDPWSPGRQVDEKAFVELDKWVTKTLVPSLWNKAQAKSSDGNFISHEAMSAVIYDDYPHEDRIGGHTAVFPATPRLSMVVEGVKQDGFRDSGLHWTWLRKSLDLMAKEKQANLLELDHYAAEELSEFLSVMGVAVIQLADRADRETARGRGLTKPEADSETSRSRLTADSVLKTIALIETMGPNRERRPQHVQKPNYSKPTLDRILASLEKDGQRIPMFADITGEVGIDFVHAPDPEIKQKRSVLKVPTGIAGGGVSACDADGDGRVDLLYFAGDKAGQLYQLKDGKFQDITTQTGLRREGETRAGYFVDYDNDGDKDLFLTFVWRPNKLYRNEGSNRFVDVTEETGIGTWPGMDKGEHAPVTHEAVWFDFDRDGLLDVYIGNFGSWPDRKSPDLGIDNRSGPPNQLFHHRSDGKRHWFEDVTETQGVGDRGWTHCVGVHDYDQDGWPDIFSMNDFGISRVYRNLGNKKGKRFEEVSTSTGFNLPVNSMNFHLMDLDHSGRLSIYVTQIHKHVEGVRYVQPTANTPVRFEQLHTMRAMVENVLFQADDSGFYRNVHHVWVDPGNFGWAWDASTFDYENDGDEDLLVLNGTEGSVPGRDNENRREFVEGRTFISQHADQNNTMSLFENGYFYDVSDRCELSFEGNSRGSAFFDFDGDGDLDVAISNYDSPARFYRNVQPRQNNWIQLRLQGSWSRENPKGSNRDAIGARVEVRYGSQRRFAEIVSGKGFLSQNPTALHFGLGSVDKVDSVKIIWPSGQTETFTGIAAGKTHLLIEGAASTGTQ